MRYEVTMSNGWKVRLNASTKDEAARKAESMNRYGDKAVSVIECHDLNPADFA